MTEACYDHPKAGDNCPKCADNCPEQEGGCPTAGEDCPKVSSDARDVDSTGQGDFLPCNIPLVDGSDALAGVHVGNACPRSRRLAYDSRANFQLLEDKGIRAGIRIKAGATCKSYGSSARPRAVRELRNLRYDGWREKHGYGIR